MTEQDSIKLHRIYEIYEQPMYRIAFAVLKDCQAAEDAVSEAFIRIIKNLGKISEPDSEKTKRYIVKIIRSTSVEQYRSRKRFFQREQAIDDETMQIPSMTDVESEVLSRQKENILSVLADDEKKLVELRCMMDMSWKDISKLLFISESAARKRFERIKKKLVSLKGDMPDER